MSGGHYMFDFAVISGNASVFGEILDSIDTKNAFAIKEYCNASSHVHNLESLTYK
jgi:hypothetical protein